MTAKNVVLGVDIGSVAVAAAAVTVDGHVVQTVYRFHHGQVARTLRSLLGELGLTRIGPIAVTASSPPVLADAECCDNRLAVIAAARRYHDRFGSILMVGGEKFGLIRFDRRDRYRSYRANSGCAAGTGSFLDQQARRLDLSGSAELAELAEGNTGRRPPIASRCAVFAKTDLVHAQQEGYGIHELCDGLCHGLARNIVDALFDDYRPQRPVVFSGGVSRNRRVLRHIADLLGASLEPEVDHYGAVGAAFSLIENGDLRRLPRPVEKLFAPAGGTRSYFFPSLSLQHSAYPDFGAHHHYRFARPPVTASNPVEVDVYEPLPTDESIRVLVGLDIGSTSTKAVLIDAHRRVMAGFYTRTAGRPVAAVQHLWAAIEDFISKSAGGVEVIGSAATGSGRKFSGGIIGADLVVDEITAHARAAVALHPEVDTIIEIGGQDAKFTCLRNGSVTFAVMNTVCAAGTGSFIEEQALQLGCDLETYAARTEGRRAPLASDRCTVFMERDIHHRLSEGYDVEEVLAAALHAVRENYLTKVANEAKIGQTICFQGATAKNRSLVAAFEQRLQKPLLVSRYCHLTGALGAALMAAETVPARTKFKGFALWRIPIPISTEVCSLCTNHCKITVARVGDESVAYGFLCGRDYETGHFVNRNRSGFDLAAVRRRIIPQPNPKSRPRGVVIGIPAALHLLEDLPYWRLFWEELGFETITSEDLKTPLRHGRSLARAEFCAPVSALHGHVHHLAKRSDHIFLPFYLEHPGREKAWRRQYCYYTQYAPMLAASAAGDGPNAPDVLSPLVHYLYSSFHAKIQLYRMLKGIALRRIGFSEVSSAYDRAWQRKKETAEKLRSAYHRALQDSDPRQIHVVLLGRPYTVLPPSMHKGIPDILAGLGIKTFYQDMLPRLPEPSQKLRPLLQTLHWHYAAGIASAADRVARTPGAYPVLLTAFKCSPDAFLLGFFQKIMDARQKPYLVLQLDDHDSRVGYETRIEAAVRAFQTHHRNASPGAGPSAPELVYPGVNRLENKTLLLPNWDPPALRLVTAALRREGVDARILEETPDAIRKSLRTNTGQCIPLNIIAQETIDYIRSHDLDPAKTVLWTIASMLPCNLRLYPHQIREILTRHGRGLEKTRVYLGKMSFSEIALRLPVDTYLAYLFAGLLRTIGCQRRPYEIRPGSIDRALEDATALLESTFEAGKSKEKAVIQAIARLEQVPIDEARLHSRPKVAIFGDLYVRDNPVFNQNLVHFIEAAGGEVVTLPYSSFVKMIAQPYLRKWFFEGKYLEVITSKALLALLVRLEAKFTPYFEPLVGTAAPQFDEPAEKILAPYGVRLEHTGESMDNLLKIYYMQKAHPDLALLVQTSPALCCPALVTEAMAHRIEKTTGLPLVSITYDGTGGNTNDAIVPYLHYLKKGEAGGKIRLRG